ncbi:ankyrin repeat domain-containing protein 29-like isoform X1 [Paramacrobiotus metropolitanus]|uniref:ankyrin repeat domain-containing protein 29-like isoform X1 n=1 Tax=Paramacrobiotus metropolitanus TaxID=2943436 RepID=UPI0024459F34|nr:ankyrin repeat domain-containing protein 29-like isoform X1 [Paramacrobiotus metropolitanus]
MAHCVYLTDGGAARYLDCIMSMKQESPHDQLLHLAALQGNLVKLRMVLDSGRVHVDVKDSDGTTPLMLAVANNHLACVEELLEQEAEVNERRNISGATALYYAAQNGFFDIITTLYRHGAEINCRCHDGGTPFAVACQSGHLDVVRYLYDHEADIHTRMNDGATALFLATQEGHEDVVRFLLDVGLDANISRADGTSPLWIAVQMHHPDTVRLLLQRGALPDVPREDGSTPLFKAVQKGYLDICQLLIAHKPRLGLLPNGNSVLHAAAWHGREEIAVMLLEHGVDLNLCDKAGKTPAQVARQRGYRVLAGLCEPSKKAVSS